MYRSLAGIDAVSDDIDLCVKKIRSFVSPFSAYIIKFNKGLMGHHAIGQGMADTEPTDPFKQAILSFFLNTSGKVNLQIAKVRELDESLIRARSEISGHAEALKELDRTLYKSYFKRLTEINKAIKDLSKKNRKR
jgi:hypothetical protein